MKTFTVLGDAFSEYYLSLLIWEESSLRPLLGTGAANETFRQASRAIREGQKNLRDRQQARSTETLLLEPLTRLLGWNLEANEQVSTDEGNENAGRALLGVSGPIARVVVLPPDAAMDTPAEGLHRRFAPAHSLVRVLEESKLTWGILINAYRIRIVRRSEGFLASSLEFDLTCIADGSREGEEAWKLIWALLRGDAWATDPCMLERVVTLGRDHMQRVNENLGAQVQQAIVSYCQGIIDHPKNAGQIDSDPETLSRLYSQALKVLYRLLFILYAESRNLLPMDLPTYRDGYSLTRLARRATNSDTDPRLGGKHGGSFFESTVRALFALLRSGVDLGPEGRIPAYGGGLFDSNPQNPDSTHLIESLHWGDATVADVLDFLTRVESKRGKGKQPVSYRELDVEHLGSIYEGLLEQTLARADDTMWRIKLDDKQLLVNAEQRHELASRRGEVVVGQGAVEPEVDETPEEDEEEFELVSDDEESDDEEGGDEDEEKAPAQKKPIKVEAATIASGTLYLKSAVGRKQSGSFYTSRALVDFLVRRAIDPLAEGKTPEEILALKVVDPAMGSGHFLVGATRRLGEHLLTAYRDRVVELRRQLGENTEAEVLSDADIPPELKRVWHDETRAMAVCRLLVAGHCMYGADKNPLAVDLAKVALWLTTAAADHPLTFLDHRLQCGDSLLGLTTETLLTPYQSVTKQPKAKKTPTKKGKPAADAQFSLLSMQDAPPDDQLSMIEELLGIAGETLRKRLARALTNLKRIRELVDNDPLDFENQRSAYLAMRGQLEPFWQLHEMRIGIGLTPGADVAPVDQALRDLDAIEYLTGETQEMGRKAISVGQKNGAFCWQLAFPDVWFDEEGRPLPNGGFSVVIGNPPWDKVKPDEREFYTEIDPTVWDYQGTARRRFISSLHAAHQGLETRWKAYEAAISAYAKLLLSGKIYTHQVTTVNGKRTGGDPDLFKFFLERAYQLLHKGGRTGIIVPLGIQTTMGCSALRKMLLDQCSLEALCKLDNERFIFQGVFHGQKFDLLVFAKGGPTVTFDAAFYSWEPADVLLSFDVDPRKVEIDGDLIRELDIEQYPLVEIRNNNELSMIRQMYSSLPKLGQPLLDTWNISFTSEVHMAKGSHYFRDSARLRTLAGVEKPGRTWEMPAENHYLAQPDRYTKITREIDSKGHIHLPGILKKDRIAYTHTGYVPSEEAQEREALPVVPGATYVPLYEGRMVHQFDHAAKAYISGSGRRSVWHELDFDEKEIVPHYFVCSTVIGTGRLARAGFCDVTGMNNERTSLGSMIPPKSLCGHTVPTCSFPGSNISMPLYWIGVLNSFVSDWLLRQKASNHLTFFTLNGVPFPRLKSDDDIQNMICIKVAKLSCFTQEMADLWEEIALLYPDDISLPWSPDKVAMDIRERANLRATIDALVADLYGLSTTEFALILSTFPLLDRDQPMLEGDVFIRRNNKGEKTTPRSFITRDKALLAYFYLKGETPPTDIVEFYTQAGVDISRQTGPIRDLRERVRLAEDELGAVAYIPTRAGAGK